MVTVYALAAALLVLLTFAVSQRAPARRLGQDYPDAPDCDTIHLPVDEEHVGGVFEAEIIRDGPRGPEVIQRRTFPNLVVNAGKKQAWRVLCGLNVKTFDQMRIGSCAAAPNSANTNLVTPITGTLNTVDSKTMSGRTLELLISYPSGGGSKSATIREAVVLNENTSPGGSCFARGVLSPVLVKTTADKARIRYRVRIT